EYGLAGDTTAAMANYAHMLTQPDYWIGMGAAFLPAGVLGRAATATDEAALLGRGAAGDATRGIPRNKSLVPFNPPNDGFLGAPLDFTLILGTRIDRIGFDGGRFLSPAGTPIPMRALRPGTETRPLRTFEVIRPLDVRAGEIAPAFGQPGLGTQFVTDRPVRDLLREGFLRSVDP
ncbi:uncharacterized protein DUF4237, partial [Halothiobacillus neapolitanus]